MTIEKNKERSEFSMMDWQSLENNYLAQGGWQIRIHTTISQRKIFHIFTKLQLIWRRSGDGSWTDDRNYFREGFPVISGLGLEKINERNLLNENMISNLDREFVSFCLMLAISWQREGLDSNCWDSPADLARNFVKLLQLNTKTRARAFIFA